MGLSLSVMCNCFVDGKAHPPFPDHVVINEYGYLDLDLPFDGNGHKYFQLSDWVESGCDHPQMNYACEGMNWTAYRSFQQALEFIGWCHFPTLRAELPETNDGVTPAAAAGALLDELAFFELADLGWTTVLVDTDTGEELHEYVDAYKGEFCINPNGYNLGVDENGFFLRSVAEGEPREVFRAMRVQQVIPDQSSATPDGQHLVEYIDLDSVQRCYYGQPTVKICWQDGKLSLGYPLRMHVIKRKKEQAEFTNVVTALRTVFEAAIKTGNPIRWC